MNRPQREVTLQRIASEPSTRGIELLKALFSTLRPSRLYFFGEANDNIRALTYCLQQRPDYRQGLRDYLSHCITTRKTLHLFTELGISPNEGFWSAFWRRLNAKWLPPAVNDDYVKDIFSQVLQAGDEAWITGVPDEVWIDFVRAIGFHRRDDKLLFQTVFQEVLTAIQVLSFRLSAIGLEPELVRNYPAIERFESPFLRQNAEVMAFVERYQNLQTNRAMARMDIEQIRVLLAQCNEIVQKIRKHAAKHGVSISLTRLLLRLTESQTRLEQLLRLVEAHRPGQVISLAVPLFKELAVAEARQYNLGALFHASTELLALQVTECAGRTGEHYVANNRGEWKALLYSSMGAGGIISVMALVKILITEMALPPFGYAFFYSMNYAGGFMLIHIFGFTIATKQPAMTAALIAGSLHSGQGRLDSLAELSLRVIRSQFIAVVGNIVIALPAAWMLAVLWSWSFGLPLTTPQHSQILLAGVSIYGPAVFYGAIAGVCLFLSGLISGYYDNKAVYNQIPGRVVRIAWLKRLLGQKRLSRIAAYIGQNLGPLAGMFSFGVMLGSVGTLGFIFGLPLDGRHITFSGANAVYAAFGIKEALSWSTIALTAAGIGAIGVANLFVSFVLALMVALRARRVSFKKGRTLARLLLQRFLHQPWRFFWPPKTEASDSDSIA